MREIKFRAWDKDNQWMVLPENIMDKDEYYFQFDNFGKIELFQVRQSNDDYQDSTAVEIDSVFMQFTGLKDKNGKEIYEGDIIEHIDRKYIVPSFTPLNRWYEADPVEANQSGTDDWISMSDVDWEIIGNIYENPELLQDKEKEIMK